MIATSVSVLIALCYFGIVASNRYVSESAVVLRSGNQSATNISFGGLLPVSNPDTQDVLIVSDYIMSMEMALYLDEKYSLREHYSDRKHDFISRLTSNANDEKYLDYFRDMVTVKYEETSSIISISASAFSPGVAHDINREIIARSELLINRLSDRIVEDTLSSAREEVESAIVNALSLIHI